MKQAQLQNEFSTARVRSAAIEPTLANAIERLGEFNGYLREIELLSGELASKMGGKGSLGTIYAEVEADSQGTIGLLHKGVDNLAQHIATIRQNLEHINALHG